MDENNQILDVTYGNFACRLEGFEDSVETMKTVVAFFHDLAGHDRFMDVEPQAPDMATLALLTEEQTGVPVEIEGEGNKVSLRVRKEHAEDALLDTGLDDADLDAGIEAMSEEDAQMEEESSAEFQTNVADKLQRLRDVTLRAAPAASDDFSEDLSDVAETVPTTNPLSQRLSELANRNAVSEDVAEEPAISDEIATEDNAPDEEDINVFSDLSKDDAAVEAVEEMVEEPAAQDANDIELAADDDLGSEEDVLAEELANNEAMAGQDEAVQEEAVADHEETAEEEVVAANDEADVDSEMPIAASEDIDDDLQSEHPDFDDLSVDEAGKPEAPLVLTSNDEATADVAEEQETDDYNDDDEFDLEAEVAKVEAELAAREGNEFARPGLPRHVEDAMSRIMSQTDQHLNQPENRRHRDAFAQLKAAVAATEAARQLGDRGADKRDPDEVYKDDLGAHEEAKEKPKSTPPLKLVKSQEVKPAPAHLQSAPSSAAVDGATERLRQIATMKEADTTEDTGGFAAFAASHGATDLVDQMEAAGAYICFVEGEEDFSRPQVMKVVQSASNTEISREDGLRSFGRLLRQARLVKQANGRFQVADNTQYRPNGTQAAQG